MAKPVVFRFLADASKLRDELSQSERELRRVGGRMQSVGRNLTTGLTLPLVAMGAASIDAASDLEQSVGAIESVLGDSADVVKDFGETAAESFGLSKREANQLGAVLGASLKGLGFDTDEAAEKVVALEQRAADLAATFGGTTSGAIEAIGSLLRGERDPIEKFGVSIKQVDVNARVAALGLDTSTAAAKKNAEAVAALDLLYSQTAGSAGAFAREQGTTAGQIAIARAEFENMRAEIGERLLPVANQLLGFANDALQAFSDLPEPVKDVAVAAGAVAAALGPLLSLGGSVIRNLDTLKGVLGSRRAGLAAAFLVSAAAAGQLGDALADLTGYSQGDLSTLSRELEHLLTTGAESAGLERTVGGIDGLVDSLDALADPDLADNIGTTTSRLIDFAAFPARLVGFDLRGTTKQMEQDLQALDQALADMVQSGNADQAAELMGMINDAAEAQGVDVGKITNLLPEYAREVEIAGVAAGDAAGSSDDLTGALGDVEEQAEDTRTDVERLTDALDGLVGVNLQAEAAASRYEAAIDGLSETMGENGLSLDLNTEKGRDNRDAIRDVIDATLRHAEALAEQGVPLLEINGLLDANREELEGVLRAAGLTEQQVNELVDSYGLIPDTITTTLDLDTAAARAALADLDKLAGNVNVGTSGLGAGGRLAGSRAHGGPVTPGQAYLVGERGHPELFVPSSAGRIEPSIGGRTTSVVVNNYGQPMDERRLVGELEWIELANVG